MDEDDDGDTPRNEYGEVLDREWHQAIVSYVHPIDGSSLYSVPARPGAPADTTIVLLHGLGNSGAVYGPVMSSLAAHGRVVAPTMAAALLRDAGEDRSTMADGLIEWLTAVTPPPWRIVGHSMGGVMTGLLLRTHPELVERAVLLNSPLPGVVQRIRRRDTIDRTGRALLFLKALAAVTRFGRPRLPNFLRGTETAAVRLALRGFVHDPGAIHPRVLARAILGSRTTDGNEFLQLAERLPTWESEPFDDVPVAIILGDSDPLVPVDDVDAIVDMYPAATVHVVANCGHFVHLEWSGLTVETISAFLSGGD